MDTAIESNFKNFSDSERNEDLEKFGNFEQNQDNLENFN